LVNYKPKKDKNHRTPAINSTANDRVPEQYTNPATPAIEDHSDFVRITSKERITQDLMGEITADIPKQLDTKVKIQITDVEGCGGWKEIYYYDLKTQKWENDNRPFDYKTPSGFLRKLREAWSEIHGPLPEKKKYAPVTSVDSTSDEITMPQYDPQALKTLPVDIKVNGFSGNVYTVNLANLSCSCPDFEKRRSGFPPTDCRRACKHIAKTITGRKLNTKITHEGILQAFIRKASSKGEGVPPFQKMLHVKINEKVHGDGEFYLLYSQHTLPWVNVVSPTAVTYGYNVVEKRWAYGDNPFPDGSKTKYTLAVQNAIAPYL